MAMWLYDLISFLVSLIIHPFERRRRAPEIRRLWSRERWARRSIEPHDIWIHAVSVGEVLAAIGVIRELRRRRPGVRIVVSTVTDTGRAVLRSRMPDLPVFYVPWDVRPLIARVLGMIRPRVLAIMETEIWPGLVHAAATGGVPVVMLNGRISDRSYRGYRRARWIMSGILSRFECLGMQSEADADRMRGIGAPPDRVRVLGNVKFDIDSPPGARPAWLGKVQRPVLVAGSTHEGEEEGLLQVFRNLRARGKNVSMILVPRKPDRFDRVEQLIRESGLPCIRRSSLDGTDMADASLTGIVLLDRMGELLDAYSIATVAFVGGSLVPVGGHNILEPALWKVPVVFGPHMQNFREIRERFLAEEGAVQVSSFEDLERTVEDLILDQEKAGRLAENGRRILERNRGASARCADLLERHLDAA